MKYTFVALALALGATARPSFSPSFSPNRRADFTLSNGQEAIAQKYAPARRRPFRTVELT